MKLSMRVTLLTILLCLILITITGLGVSSYWNADFIAHDLSTQILDHASWRIDGRINELLLTANRQATLNRLLLEAGDYRLDDYHKLARYWVEVMKTRPELARLSVGMEATGELSYVRRLHEGKLAIGELRRASQTGKLRLKDYWPEDYPKTPFFVGTDESREDPRARPWYLSARDAGRPVWSETYVIVGVTGHKDLPGVSYVTPFYAADKTLLGVFSATIDLYELSQFLGTMAVSPGGIPFVVEYRADGSQRVIAHPRPEILLRAAGNDGGRELVPVSELADPALAAFLKQVPASLDPAKLTGMKQMRFELAGVAYLGCYRCLSNPETPDWLIGILLPEQDVLAQVKENNRTTFFIGLGILVVAVLASLYIAAQVSQPLEQLAREAAAIGQMHIEDRPLPHSMVHEVENLARATEEMMRGLRSFQKYVPADLVRALLTSGQEAALGGERRTMTIAFSDIVNFTSVSEMLSPEELVEHLSAYLDAMSQQIHDCGGTVDKYIGDAIMAFWGAPVHNPGHALAACKAALANQARLRELRGQWQKEGKLLWHARIGVHTGEVVIGNIGSKNRLNYTVIGDAVNLASRLEGLNRFYGTQILISETTYREAQPWVIGRAVDWVSVKGKKEAVLIYELLGPKGAVSSTSLELTELYAGSLANYRAQNWTLAIQQLEELLRKHPGDGPAQVLLGRCQAYTVEPPGPKWDGVHRMTEK